MEHVGPWGARWVEVRRSGFRARSPLFSLDPFASPSIVGYSISVMGNTNYINRTGSDVRPFHEVIVEAITNGGEFTEDYSDIFTLTENPEGISCGWILTFREDS